MTSYPRRGSGPVRQHSLQQLPRRHHQVRRQRSAEEDRSLQIRTTDPIRARRDNDRSSVIERPKVRIAWGDNDDESRATNGEDPERRVEVVACQIGTGKLRSVPSARQPRMIGRNSATDKNCSTLLYSRQELAERLRLAWKQREANKSNIDVFLAHGTIEERSDSRLSSSSSVDRSPVRLSTPARRSYATTMDLTKNENNKHALCEIIDDNAEISTKKLNDSVENSSGIENTISSTSHGCSDETARSKRASFKNATNTAFLQPVNDPAVGFTVIASTTKKEIHQTGINASTIEQKNRRTNSAPPQRRSSSVGPTSNKTQVSIVIEAPGIFKPVQESTSAPSCTDSANCSSGLSGHVGRSVKSVASKRRSKSAKKRANSLAGKEADGGRAKFGNNETKNTEVVTMVSLVSDADSDSETEANSPHDDKLISQLRSNLPTTPIIKSNINACCSLNSIARRTIKSVSFQQDSIEIEDETKRILRIRPRSVQVGHVTGSALPTPEEARTWRTDVASLTTMKNIDERHSRVNQEITEVCLTDREKRCLIVPIGDTRSDKKRKLLRTRSTPPSRVDGVEKQSTMMHQADAGEVFPRTRIPPTIEKFLPAQQSTAILLQASVSKLAENVMARAENEPELDGESVESALQTTKEKECWHLYRRMCDKGVCVSFDTVLRGMLTPTEYRLRRKEMT